VTRNQLARNIEVMISNKTEYKGKNKPLHPLHYIKNDLALFLLITPRIFKDEFPNSRLYGYKMDDYMSNPRTLRRDLSHIEDLTLDKCTNISKRIGWTTWEEIDNL